MVESIFNILVSLFAGFCFMVEAYKTISLFFCLISHSNAPASYATSLKSLLQLKWFPRHHHVTHTTWAVVIFYAGKSTNYLFVSGSLVINEATLFIQMQKLASKCSNL